MNRRNISLLSLLSAFIFPCLLHSQSPSEMKKFRKNPEWIRMMKDTSVNYFTAVKAFDLYWESRPKPVEEEDIIGQEHGKRNERNAFLTELFKSRKEKRREESEQYAMDYRKFKNWQRQNLPFVQPDGSILGPAARLKIWNEQKQH